MPSSSSIRPTRRPPTSRRRSRGSPRGWARRARADAARRDRHRQDVHDGGGDRAGAAPGAGDRPQQDAGGAALQRVPRVLPRQRRRVLRQLLRLLPARGLRAGAGPLHREGLLDQRRDRPAAPRRHGLAVRAQGRDHRRLGLLHLRDRLAAALQGADAPVQGRRVDRPRGAVPEAGRDAVPPQRHQPRPRHLQRPRRGARDLPRLRRVRLPDPALRRRDRGDPALRPADRRDPRRDRPRLGLAGEPLRGQGGDDGARGGPDRLRADRAGEAASSRRASSSRPTGCCSGPSTTWR